ncbi:hypothetical protein BDA99DRAFT_537095 [Phascolomyces articulosus]|uniref:Uncharacterized protein n=1 Tax=Phascolomyces articulosus TaxID=60185 RepID=A0AAD5PGB4_9FUNG|nr:hypothetical protein BDA99DRAFT_537095 [Phascolomyces articulosus]
MYNTSLSPPPSSSSSSSSSSSVSTCCKNNQHEQEYPSTADCCTQVINEALKRNASITDNLSIAGSSKKRNNVEKCNDVEQQHNRCVMHSDNQEDIAMKSSLYCSDNGDDTSTTSLHIDMHNSIVHHDNYSSPNSSTAPFCRCHVQQHPTTSRDIETATCQSSTHFSPHNYQSSIRTEGKYKKTQHLVKDCNHEDSSILFSSTTTTANGGCHHQQCQHLNGRRHAIPHQQPANGDTISGFISNASAVQAHFNNNNNNSTMQPNLASSVTLEERYYDSQLDDMSVSDGRSTLSSSSSSSTTTASSNYQDVGYQECPEHDHYLLRRILHQYSPLSFDKDEESSKADWKTVHEVIYRIKQRDDPNRPRIIRLESAQYSCPECFRGFQ